MIPKVHTVSEHSTNISSPAPLQHPHHPRSGDEGVLPLLSTGLRRNDVESLIVAYRCKLELWEDKKVRGHYFRLTFYLKVLVQ